MEPLVSIIIPTYNRSGFLGETLESVMNQNFQNWECIVVDDGSDGGEEELIEAYCSLDVRIKFFSRPKNHPKGANACRNYGFSMSQGEFIQWFDSDDVMLPELIESQVSAIGDSKSFAVCLGYIVDQQLRILKPMKFGKPKSIYEGILTWEHQIITNSVLFRRSFLEQKKLFDIRITRNQDTEFFTRMFYEVEPKEFLLTEQPLFLKREHDQNITFQNKSNYHFSHKDSTSFNAIENLKRNLNGVNLRLARGLYIQLIKLLFQGIDHGNLRGSTSIIKNLLKMENLYTKKERIVFRLAVQAAMFFTKGRWRIRKFLLNQKLEVFKQ